MSPYFCANNPEQKPFFLWYSRTAGMWFTSWQSAFFLSNGDDHCLGVRQRIGASWSKCDSANHVEHRLGRARCRSHVLSDDHGLRRFGATLGGSAKGRVWISRRCRDRANELRPCDAIYGCRCTSPANSCASVVHGHTRRIGSIDGQSVWSEDGENNVWSGRKGCVGDGPSDVTGLTHVGVWSLSITRD